MTTKKIVLAPQDTIELFEATAREFFRDVLDQNFNECLVTDESHLSDWSSCGMSDYLADKTASLEELYAAWDIWMLAELKARFELDYSTTAVPFVQLFRDIEVFKARRIQ